MIDTTVHIPLITGGFALIDSADIELVSGAPWRHARIGKHVYARTDEEGRTVLMHRVLMGLSAGDPRVVDHIDGNGLDNRRQNMRICTAGENARNRSRTTNTTGYKGVFARGGRFVAQIACPKQYLGCFGSKHAAAVAYNEAAKQRFGEFASLNKIDREGYAADLKRLLAEARSEVSNLERLLAEWS